MKDNPKLKKALKIASNVLFYAVLIICIIGIALTVTGKKEKDGAVSIFGMQMRLVITNSMEKCDQTDVSGYKIKDIPLNSMVFIEEVPDNPTEAKAWYSELKVGDVLTFKYDEYSARQMTITHRITEIKENADGSGYIIRLEGDNKNTEDGALVQEIDTSKRATSFNYVIGKVTGQSYLLGLMLTLFKSPIGLILIIVASIIIIGFEVFKLVKLASEEKKNNDQKEIEAKDNELDELRRRLAELESSRADTVAEGAKAEESVADAEPTPEGEAT